MSEVGPDLNIFWKFPAGALLIAGVLTGTTEIGKFSLVGLVAEPEPESLFASGETITV